MGAVRNQQIIELYNTSLSAKIEYKDISDLLCKEFNISRNRLCQILGSINAPRWVRCPCCNELFLADRSSKAKYCSKCNTTENRILIRRAQQRIVDKREREKNKVTSKYFNYFKEAYVSEM